MEHITRYTDRTRKKKPSKTTEHVTSRVTPPPIVSNEPSTNQKDIESVIVQDGPLMPRMSVCSGRQEEESQTEHWTALPPLQTSLEHHKSTPDVPISDAQTGKAPGLHMMFDLRLCTTLSREPTGTLARSRRKAASKIEAVRVDDQLEAALADRSPVFQSRLVGEVRGENALVVVDATSSSER